MRDRLLDLIAFVRAAEAGSFTAAAEHLGISRSAVGKAVARLEAQLGVRLIHRTTRSQSLTPEGRQFLTRCARLLDELEDAKSLVSQDAEQPSGELRLELPSTLGRRHVVPLIMAFMERWPRIGVTATFSNRFVDLAAEGIDLAIRIGQADESRLVSRRLATNRLITCASPAYIARKGMPADVEALARHDCLTFLSYGRPLAWRFRVEGSERSWVPNSRLKLSEADALRDAALAGLGVAQLDEYLVGDDLRDGRLVRLLPAFECNGPDIRAVYPTRRYLAPKVRLFIDFVGNAWRMPPWRAA